MKQEKELLALRAKLPKKKVKKSRSSGRDTLNYLREKGERTKCQNGLTLVKKAKV